MNKAKLEIRQLSKALKKNGFALSSKFLGLAQLWLKKVNNIKRFKNFFFKLFCF